MLEWGMRAADAYLIGWFIQPIYNWGMRASDAYLIGWCIQPIFHT